jgi:hypothetical protein
MIPGSKDPGISKQAEIAQPAFDGLRHLAGDSERSLPSPRHKARHWAKARGESIARVFDIELKTGLRKHRSAPGRRGVPMGKIHGGPLAPEYSAASSFRVPRDPKAMAIAADEENRDRGVDDLRTRPQKG